MKEEFEMKQKFLAAKARFQSFVACKLCGVQMEDGDHLVEVLGTIIIAVFLLFLFRDEVKKIFESMIANTEKQLDSLFGTHGQTPAQ